MANPRGQQRDKPYRDALRRAIARATSRAEDDPHALDRIAEAHLSRCSTGDMAAIKELADRLDGKPAQAIIGGEEDDPAIQAVARIEIVAPNVDRKG